MLKLKIVIIFAALTLAAAFPYESDMDTDGKVRYCQPQTPCRWRFFKYMDSPEVELNNSYCVCRPNQKCLIHEHNFPGNYLEYRCKF